MFKVTLDLRALVNQATRKKALIYTSPQAMKDGKLLRAILFLLRTLRFS